MFDPRESRQVLLLFDIDGTLLLRASEHARRRCATR